MILPLHIQEKINKMILKNKTNDLKKVQKSMTEKYKSSSGTGKSLIESKNDGLLYAVSRMPATYSVILTLLNQLNKQQMIDDFSSVIDVGCGTGAGYFAVKEFNGNVGIKLFEREKNMIDIFNQFETGEIVQKFDLIKDELNCKADLVLSSYVLSELGDEQRINAAKKLYDASNKYLLLIDTGTPKVWAQMMEIKKQLINYGAKLVAPCQRENCLLQDDYCQFFARVERTSIHKAVKDATLSYEDEKYFYLLFSKDETIINDKSRIIRRPSIKQNVVELFLCSSHGLEKKSFSKRDKEEYKLAKKSKINDLI